MNKANLPCEECYKFFKKRKAPTPCGTCPKPTLMAENQIAWELFEDTTQQLRVGGMGGIFGFEFSALPVLFTIHQIPEEDWFVMFKKLNTVYSIALRIWNVKDTNKK